MIKNRTTQLVFQTVYCVLAVLGILGSLGYFNGEFNYNFYVYYTNLSNYICAGVMFVSLARTIKSANKKEDGYCQTAPVFNFMCVIMILVTFLVYNILLAKDSTVVEYFTSLSNLIMHAVLPLMFILNWVLFYKHGTMKWYQPLLCLVMPLVYVVYIFVRAMLITDTANTLVYPYFFLNVNELGWGGVLAWIGVLLVAFVVIGYIFYGLNHLKGGKKGR